MQYHMMPLNSRQVLLNHFIEAAKGKGLYINRSHGKFWYRETEEAWERYKKFYGLCPSGHVFSFDRMTCVTCGEGDSWEVIE